MFLVHFVALKFKWSQTKNYWQEKKKKKKKDMTDVVFMSLYSDSNYEQPSGK